MRTLEEIIERIKNKTVEKDGHWLFQGALNKGQGVISFNYCMVGVHRLSAAYYLGYDLNDPINQVNHKIECRYGNCWNHNHLYIGTEAENKEDRFHKDEWHTDNQYTNATHCIRGHEFTEENTRNTKKGRKCIQCEKDYNKRYRESRLNKGVK